jgi:hypothetical protein
MKRPTPEGVALQGVRAFADAVPTVRIFIAPYPVEIACAVAGMGAMDEFYRPLVEAAREVVEWYSESENNELSMSGHAVITALAAALREVDDAD